MTYESSVCLENISLDNTVIIPLPETDIIKDTENCTICFLDLETTGLSDDRLGFSCWFWLFEIVWSVYLSERKH